MRGNHYHSLSRAKSVVYIELSKIVSLVPASKISNTNLERQNKVDAPIMSQSLLWVILT